MAEQKNTFSSSIGAIMAAVGSAVGLGNIWRFPYICGKYGGGAFLIVYLLFVFLIGMVLMMSEFVIGRHTQHTPAKAFSTIAPKHKGWTIIGVIGVITLFFIQSQYHLISGWVLNYFADSCTGTIAALGQDAAAVENHFQLFSTSVGKPLIFMAIFAIITGIIIIGGVQNGIERISKILMPFLLVLILVLCVRSLTLPGASKGLAYLFNPDFSKLTLEGIHAALGQALFSLSVGMGVMVVYGSYIPVDDNLFKTSLWITASDTLIAILAGIAIFPAVFSCGLEPAGGPGLVFKVLPQVFNSMTPIVGSTFAALFFLLVVIAALTSNISLLEGLAAWLTETIGSSRLKSTLIFGIATIAMAAIISLSNGVWSGFKIGGVTFFDFVDNLNSIYLPPVCALLTVIFLGWVMPEKDIREELSNHGTLKIGYYKVFRFLARFIAPIALIVVLYGGIFM